VQRVCCAVRAEWHTTRRKRFRFDVVEKAGRKTIFFLLLVRTARTTNYIRLRDTRVRGCNLRYTSYPSYYIIRVYSTYIYTCSSCVSLTFFFFFTNCYSLFSNYYLIQIFFTQCIIMSYLIVNFNLILIMFTILLI